MLLSLVRKARKRPNRPPASWCGPSLRLVNSSLLWSSKTSCVCVCVATLQSFHDLSSPTRYRTWPLPVKAWSHNHWTTSEFLCSKTVSLDPSFQQHTICNSKRHQEQNKREISLANSGPSSFRNWVRGKKSHSFRFSQVLNTADSSEIF